MSIKCGHCRFPYGGGKGGIECDPRKFPSANWKGLPGICPGHESIVGPTKDIPAPDVFTNSQIMAWMLDEYSRIREFDSPAFITGKPLVLGGSRGRETATAKGVTIMIREAAKRRNLDLKDARVVMPRVRKRRQLPGEVYERRRRQGDRHFRCVRGLL